MVCGGLHGTASQDSAGHITLYWCALHAHFAVCLMRCGLLLRVLCVVIVCIQSNKQFALEFERVLKWQCEDATERNSFLLSLMKLCKKYKPLLRVHRSHLASRQLVESASSHGSLVTSTSRAAVPFNLFFANTCCWPINARAGTVEPPHHNLST